MDFDVTSAWLHQKYNVLDFSFCPAFTGISKPASPYEAAAFWQAPDRKGEPGGYVHVTATLGKNVTVETGSLVDEGVVLEDNVAIGTRTLIERGTSIGSDTQVGNGCHLIDIEIGNGVKMGDGVSARGGVNSRTIGDGCVIADGVSVAWSKMGDRVTMDRGSHLVYSTAESGAHIPERYYAGQSSRIVGSDEITSYGNTVKMMARPHRAYSHTPS